MFRFELPMLPKEILVQGGSGVVALLQKRQLITSSQDLVLEAQSRPSARNPGTGKANNGSAPPRWFGTIQLQVKV